MAERDPQSIDERRRFRSTLIKVMAVQVVTLLALWLLQVIYHR